MKVVVIGAGPSGLVAAIYAKKNGNEVVILERNNDIAKKILLTGNGKCNYYNDDQDISHYHSLDNSEISKIINKTNITEILNFFDELGIVPKIKDGYYYPFSNQAVSIKSVLKSKINELGIDVITNYLVTDIKKENDWFVINNDMKCDSLIIATGSKAYPKTGSDGSGYIFLEKFNHTINEILPALVQVKSDDKYLKELKGVRTSVTASIFINDEFIKEEEGELQLTDSGLSGICIFNLSYIAVKNISLNKKVKIKINYLPFIKTKEKLKQYFNDRNKKINKKCMSEFFDGLLNYKLSNIILKKSNISFDNYYDDLTNLEKDLLIENINSYEYNITSSLSFDNAQVCQGGVLLSEVNLSTMESLKEKNLYIVGEILDINGDCGGYNLTNAFISGYIAGVNIK